ncbi:hypothetical protein H6G97_25835 [Nostoc flagelliforme FACHB-838]|uniref:Transposase n=1 Tax=Nostoc flagelliforme FACHB-838 TaxID=2692904 RepID=A0ABR8DVB5_9NOSO|nr:hypothetical protein [Nostoc flagelliforme]MBD2532820.1 hypothetical protein [Nostoc flagelliforme FACHB-838]
MSRSQSPTVNAVLGAAASLSGGRAARSSISSQKLEKGFSTNDRCAPLQPIHYVAQIFENGITHLAIAIHSNKNRHIQYLINQYGSVKAKTLYQSQIF